MYNLRKIGTVAAVSAVAAALMFAVPTTVSAFADDAQTEPDNSAALSAIQARSDIAYAYFDAPTAVHADASGIHVTCADGVVTINVRQTSGIEISEPNGVTADKAYKHGDAFVALENGVITAVGNDDSATVEFSPFPVIDFDICGDTLYAAGKEAIAIAKFTDNGALDVSSAVELELSASGYRAIEVSEIAAASDKVYVALSSALAPFKHDIATVDLESGKLTTVLLQSDEISALTVMAHSGDVYALTRDRITCYSGGNTLKPKYTSDDARMKDLYAYDGFLYALDTLGTLYKANGNLSEYKELCASASHADGFFNGPTGAAVKNSTLFVADSVNNRIAAYGDNALSYISDKLVNPVSVACDSRGTLYVAHDFDKVSIGDETEFTVDGAIKHIVVNADKTVFVLTDDGLWCYDGAPAKISSAAYKDITLGIGRDELYALSSDGVYKLAKNAVDEYVPKRYCAAPSDAFSLAVDFAGNVFALTENGITRTQKNTEGTSSRDIPLTLDDKPYKLLNGGRILLSTVDNEYVGYGDAVIVDTFKHRILAADGSSSGLDVKLIDGNDYDAPDYVGDKTPSRYDGLIRTALYDVPVFSLPIETPEIYTIKKGRKVIVPEYDLDDTREFSFILVDDTDKHELIQGYVYKDALSDALQYVSPPADSLSPYSGATPVYKWPSPHSQTVNGYSPALAGDSLEAIDFVDEFRDYKNNLWYRVRVGDNFEGYMLAADVNLGEYETTTIRPAYNAEIISYKGSKTAQTYIFKNGKYTPIDITLDTGTEIEVVGAFDTSERYTKIKCLTERGTVTCYVETVYVEYTGVNIVLLVAVVVIIITAVLAAVIIARVVRLKKKRLTTPPDDRDYDE